MYIEIRFDISNFELDRQFPKGKNKKVIGLRKDEVGAQIMKQSFGLRAKICSNLRDSNDENKKAQTECVIRR